MSRMQALGRSVPVIVLAAAALGGCGEDPEAASWRARHDAQSKQLQADIEKLEKSVEQRQRDLRSAVESIREGQDALTQRVATLEARPAPSAAGGVAAADAAAAKPAVPDKKALIAEMKALQDKVFADEATDEEQQRFWELARTTAAIDDVMKAIEVKVKDHPDDLENRMQLAQAYIAKLQTVPSGMEQGMWSMKAETQWREILKRDPDHWDARFSMAFGWTFWPEQFNKTPDAIKEFEKIREIQERKPSEAKHAQTYLQLARLYQKQNKGDKAKDTLRAGLARHPDDAELKKLLASLEE